MSDTQRERETERERGLALRQRSIDSEKEIKAVVGRGRNVIENGE